MRNRLNIVAATSLLALFSLAGCGPDQKAKDQLTQGFSSLNNGDAEGAKAQADAFLAHTPAGPGTVEALYLKGRALELKHAANPADVRSNLSEARAAYVQALARQPKDRKVLADLHSSLGNVAYFQDDYASAINEWTTAYDLLDDDTSKAWVLYRIGVCRQRTGAFADADAAFDAVMQRFPGTVPAQRAKDHRGTHAFFLQIASFSSAAAADAAVADLRRQGITAQKKPDASGHVVVQVGPLPGYTQAAAVKQRLAARYPDSLILP